MQAAHSSGLLQQKPQHLLEVLEELDAMLYRQAPDLLQAPVVAFVVHNLLQTPGNVRLCKHLCTQSVLRSSSLLP